MQKSFWKIKAVGKGSAAAPECVRFERDLFGALHQMMSGLSEAEREKIRREIEQIKAV